MPFDKPPSLEDDMRLSLVHSEIIEFVMTHKLRTFGLYPLLNFIPLLLQKPTLLVVFKARPHVGIASTAWAHTMRAPHGRSKTHVSKSLSDKLDRQIAALLADESTYSRWLVQFDSVKHRDGRSSDIYALGALHLSIAYRTATGSPSEQALDPDATQANFLSRQDFMRLQALVARIHAYQEPPTTPNMPGDRTHLRHIARYWEEARDRGGIDELFTAQSGRVWADPGEAAKAAGSEFDLPTLLAPVFSEIEAIYRDLRGGRPGSFDSFSSSTEAGAPLLWSRHRESLARGDGWRPPTIAFYLQVRAPPIGPEMKPRGFRIVPVATQSMCLDEAAVILEYIKRSKNKRQAKRKTLEFLTSLGVADPAETMLETTEALSKVLLEATSLKHFLGAVEVFNTNTYPAFLSGISTFTKAQPCSRADRFAYGPDFLREPNNIDTAFIKPTLVSGFPYIAIVTKTRSGIDPEDQSEFHTFHYNYIFQTGIIRRWISRRIRSAVETAYLNQVSSVFTKTLLSKTEVIIFEDAKDRRVKWKYRPEQNSLWIDEINNRLELVGQAFPYAIIQIHHISLKEWSESPSKTTFELFGHYFECRFTRNNYYFRKLIDNDPGFMRESKVMDAVDRALKQAKTVWSQRIGHLE
ncbi:hypothetical protein [Accumulibacter sp.]|uniref:hypothetical protein n=1 Tax=Accumulibacter sp. TaxID=2053492 RepID=UPI00258E896D|nr:hypothetical protein [Accumulibacter sp.]